MMLETRARDCWRWGRRTIDVPTRSPKIRLGCSGDCGRIANPFTTGILIGIGETLDERVDALFAIREVNEKYGHIQEVIVQNFRAKPDTLFANRTEPTALDVARTAAVARPRFSEAR